MIRLSLLVLAGALTAAPAAAQGRLEARLDPQTLASLRPLFDAARRDSIPLSALEDKALEGAAKRVPGERIVAALHRLADELRAARALLRGAAESAPLPDAEIVAAADATRRGVPPGEIAALGRRAPATVGLVVPLTVLGDLVQRGVPADEARRVLEELLDAGVTPEQLAEIPARVDIALRVGAPPLEALRNALPVPVRPGPPGQPPAGPPPSGPPPAEGPSAIDPRSP